MENDTFSKLYKLMLLCRRYEEEIARLWHNGSFFGEMHLGIGEEAIIVGILANLLPGDVIATDHRSTPPFLMRGGVINGPTTRIVFIF